MSSGLLASPSPSEQGYRMPAEWEPHVGTWFTFPRPEGISFPGKFEPVPAVYAALFRELLPTEEIHLNVWDTEREGWVRDQLTRNGTPVEQIHFHHFPAYEPWCRDHGPTFVVRSHHGCRERAVVDWGYNAWGGKYPPYDLDDAIPRHVARYRRLPLFSPGIVMEGGSLDVNGYGTVLTTEACLLNPNRNPGLSRADLEQYLAHYLGTPHVLWLGEGIVGDDTDGHIDDLARFVNPTTVVTILEDDPQDRNYAVLKENRDRLRHMTDQNGNPLRVVDLPCPGVVEHDGERLPASYANFYIANGVVLVPTYRHPNDRKAVEILQREFPDRRVVGIDSTELIWGLGSFHCISQQEPA